MKPESAVRTKRVLAGLGAVLGLTVSTLYGATITWTNTSGGVWSSPLNWSPNIVPRGSDTVQITAAGTYTVTVDTNVAIQSLTLGGASGAQILTNNAQTIGITNSCLVGANGVLNLGGGTLSGGLLTLQGMFNWASGTVAGPLTVGGGGVLNITGNVSLYNVLTNAGTVTMSGAANLAVFNNSPTYKGAIYNQAAALWDLQTNANIQCEYCVGNEIFNNAGTFRKSGGASGTATISVVFANTGTVTNLTGILYFSGGGSLTGTYGTAAGATTQFANGNFTMGVPPVISGLGVCEFTGATLTLTQNWPTNLVLAGGNVVLGPAFQNSGGISNLTLNGATLISTNTVTGTFNWASGTVAGPLTVGGGGVLNITGNVSLYNVLTNAGTVTMSGAANLAVFNNSPTYKGAIYNQAAALWDLQTNANIQCEYCVGNEIFNNAGTFRKSGGASGTATISVVFANTGTVTNLTGILYFSGGGSLTGTYGTAAGATTQFANGNFTMGVPPVISGLGVCEFTGATLTLTQNWPTNLVLAGGNVVLGPAFQNSGGISNLTLNGATLISTNTVTGTFNWASGTVAGPLTVGGGGVLNITGNVSLYNVLTNAGTVTMSGAANLAVFNNSPTYKGAIYNQAAALWDLQTNANIQCEYCVGNEIFNNAGTFRKSGGASGTATISVVFANTGTVTNLTGILYFSGGGSLTGTYGTAAGATTQFANGNFTMGVPPVISGLGVCEFTGATLTLTQNWPTNLVLAGGNVVLGPAFQNSGGISNLTLNGATLISTNTVTGTFNWASGTVAGPLTVGGGGVLNITGNVSLYNVLTNAGTVTMSGAANLAVFNNSPTYKGAIYNQAAALWDLQTNANIQCEYCVGNEIFNNAGTFRKSGGASGTATISVVFANTGTVTNLTGILYFSGGGSLTGTYGTAAGATTQFANGNFTMGVPPVISGLGVCEFTGATLTLTQNWPTNLVLAGGNVVLGPAFQNSGGISNLTLNGATLISTNTVTGTFNWASGTVAGPLTVGGGGVLNITGNVSLYNVLTNAGTVTMSGAANLAVFNNSPTYKGAIYNQAAALWDLQTNANIQCEYCVGNEIFNNAGTFRKSGGASGTATISVVFANTGTVDALAGILSFSGAFTNAGGTLAFGVSSLASFGRINVSGNVALNGTAGATWLNGFMPAVGNSFAVLDYGSHSGTFATITLPPGYLGQGIYGATIFSLMVTNTNAPTNLPVFLNIKLVNPSNVVVSWPSTATNYTLQTSTNLSSGSWSNVTSGITTVSTNDVLTNQVNGKAGFFRLQSP